MKKSRESYVDHTPSDYSRAYITSKIPALLPGFTKSERKKIITLIQKEAEFSDICVRAYCVCNHAIHLLVDTPKQNSLSDQEMSKRYEASRAPKLLRDKANRETLRKRFANLGSFLKAIKQIIAQQYHRKRGSSGALWTSRYTSTFVQAGAPSQFLAAWIAHANVRAGDASEAASDTSNFYGRALKGDRWSRQMVTDIFHESSKSWVSTNLAFTRFLDSEPANANIIPKGSKRKKYLTRQKTMLTEIDALTSGCAFGDEAFVEGFFQKNRAQFGPKRKTGARAIIGQNDPNLFTMRYKTDLRVL